MVSIAKLYRVSLFSTLVVLVAMLVSPGLLRADSNLNCQAYAAAAVKQAKENKQRGCNYTGSLWSLDFNGHKNWCLSPGVKMANLTWGDKERARLLQQCKGKQNKKYKKFHKKQKQCLAYAHEAKKLRGELNKVCKKSGEWPAPLKADVDWCMGQSVGAAKLKNTLRRNKITQCKLNNRNKVFLNPGTKLNRVFLPIDICNRKHDPDKFPDSLYGKQLCGQKNANLFCQKRGYAKAIHYKTKNFYNGSNMDGEKPTTWWQSLLKPCHGRCSGFTKIVCTGQGAPGK